ncbi:MAG: ribbon-helix-helix protein, CopG family [Nitrososphaerota archaeon]
MKRALKDSRDIHIRLPQDLYRALEERASSEGVPVSLLIRRILRSALGL